MANEDGSHFGWLINVYSNPDGDGDSQGYVDYPGRTGRIDWPMTKRQFELQDAADAILRGSGDSAMTDHVLHTEVFSPSFAYGERLRALPKHTSRYEPREPDAKPIKHGTLKCPKCGGPKSKFSISETSVCKKCYHAKALKRHEKAVERLYLRTDEHLARFSYMVAHFATYWLERERVEPDFAVELIEQITALEVKNGCPFVWLEQTLSKRQDTAEANYTMARELQEALA
jgi:hypothetical protein